LSTVALELPDDIIEEAQEIARGRNLSVESILQDGLVMIFGKAVDSDISADILEDFSDEQLWEIVNRRLPWSQDSRMRELTALGKRTKLTEQQMQELENLLAALDRQILLRSRALLQMKRRGLDVDSFLGF
jgi:hypothetical protein